MLGWLSRAGRQRVTVRFPSPGAALVSAVIAIALTAVSIWVFIIPHSSSQSVRTFAPVADTYVSTAHQSSNYGEGRVLRTSAVPSIRTFLRFSLRGLSAPVAKATLRLWSEGASSVGYAVRPVEDGDWEERTITSDSAPASGEVVASSGAFPAHAWASADVTELVTGNGEISLAITTTSHTSIEYDSREADHPPEVVVETQSPSSGNASRAGAAGGTAAPSMRSIIEDVPAATGYRYGATDDKGHSMDTLKIIAAPDGYLGVYHWPQGGSFSVMVATSTDLLHWNYRATLAVHASQPTITQLSDHGYLVVQEADNQGQPGSDSTWLRFSHYPGLDALLTARPDRTFDAPHTLAKANGGAEGTPNIYSTTLTPDLASSTITVGFHYLGQGGIDQPARGTLRNFSTWSAQLDAQLVASVETPGSTDNIGDRDYIVYHGSEFTISEVQTSHGAPWQPYLYEHGAGKAQVLHVRTHRASASFGNPTLTSLPGPSGAPAVVVTFFLPRSGAAQGETGELIYYRQYGAPGRNAAAASPGPAIARGVAGGADPVIAAVGDIACAPSSPMSSLTCHQRGTADLIQRLAPNAVLTLGDDQYEAGSLKSFQASYDATWGPFKAITYPVPGNHEYLTSGAAGYFDYYGAAAGDPSKGYYSFDIGSWHFIALNGNCAPVGGCGPDSPQEQWLRADLAAHGRKCTLAFWHQPRFSSGQHGSDPTYQAFWEDLYDAKADVVLNGHDHDYERFAPQDPSGNFDATNGLREFVVGTGGKNHYGFTKIANNSQARDDTSFGILQLTLHPGAYDWRFVPEAGAQFTDSGSGSCH
jgi:acid phosphatase type 7